MATDDLQRYKADAQRSLLRCLVHLGEEMSEQVDLTSRCSAGEAVLQDAQKLIAEADDRLLLLDGQLSELERRRAEVFRLQTEHVATAGLLSNLQLVILTIERLRQASEARVVTDIESYSQALLEADESFGSLKEHHHLPEVAKLGEQLSEEKEEFARSVELEARAAAELSVSSDELSIAAAATPALSLVSDTIRSRTCAYFWRDVIQPVLQSVFAHDRITCTVSATEWSVQLNAATSDITVQVSCLQELFLFFKRRVLRNDACWLSELGTVLITELPDMFYDRFLLRRLPDSVADRDQFTLLCELAAKFHQFLQDESIFATPSDKLLWFSKRANDVFMEHVATRKLATVQQLVRTKLRSAVIIEAVGTADVELSAVALRQLETCPFNQSPFSSPRYRVNECAAGVLEVVKQTLQEASDCPAVSQQLCLIARQVLELYLATFPATEDDLALTALLYSSALHVAHELTKLPRGPVSLVDFVPRYTEFADALWDSAISTLRDVTVPRVLKQALELTALDSREDAVQVALDDTMLLFRTTCASIQPVLPRHLLLLTLGHLVNSALDRVVSSLLSISDIRAVDSAAQYRLLTAWRGDIASWISSLAQDSPAEVTLSRCVSSWSRFSDVLYVLSASLGDVMAQWADGAGPLTATLEPGELRDLIRALFQNTDRRQAALKRIA